MTTAPPPPPGEEQPSGSTPPPAGGSGGFPPPPPPPPSGDQGGGYGAPQPGYGQPPQQGYGAPAPGYGQPPQGYGAPQGYAAPGGQLASWGQRVGGALLDYFAPFIVAAIVYAINKPLGAIVYLVAIAWAFYQAYLGGQTGQSLGKKQVGIRLISEKTGQPIGGGMGIARYLLHIVDGLPCYIGYLWPLWDSKKQTFADKIVTTVVVKT